MASSFFPSLNTSVLTRFSDVWPREDAKVRAKIKSCSRKAKGEFVDITNSIAGFNPQRKGYYPHANGKRVWENARMFDSLQEVIRKRLKELDRSEAAAMRKGGLHKDTFRDLRRSKRHTVSSDKLPGIAKGLDWSLAELMQHVSPSDDHIPSEVIASEGREQNPDLLEYAGSLEAGAFREVDELDQRQPHTIPRLRSPKYPKARHWAWQVRGDSMNLEQIFDGMWVEGVDYEDFVEHYGDLRDGDIVVAEVINRQGQRERTVKKLYMFKDRIELRPQSTSSHKTIILPRVIDPDATSEGRIIALVIEWFKISDRA